MSVRTGCTPVPGPGSAVCHVWHATTGYVTSHTVHTVVDALAGWAASGAAWLLGAVGSAMQSSTQVHLGAPWFTSHERLMATIAAATAAPLLMAALLQALVRQDAALLARAALVQLPLALLLSGLAVQLVALGLRITDQLCASFARASGGSLHRSLQHMAVVAGAMAAAPGLGGASTLIVLLVALLLVVAALVLWLELLVRAAAVYVAVLFLPLAMVSLVWPPIAQFGRRLWHLLAGLVLSKFVIVAVLVLAVGAVGSQSRGSGGVSTLLAGAAMFFLAAFMPFVLLRFVPVAEGALNLEGVRARGVRTAVAVPVSAARLALGAGGALPMAGAEAGTGLVGAGGEVAGADAGGGVAGIGPAGGAAGTGASGGPGGGPDGRGPVPPRKGRLEQGAPDPGSGVPSWQGNPASDQAFEQRLGDRGPSSEVGTEQGRTPTAASTVLRVGAPPVWGFPVQSISEGEGEGEDESEVPSHVIDEDRLGPVIRYVPPPGAPGHPDDGTPGHPDDGTPGHPDDGKRT